MPIESLENLKTDTRFFNSYCVYPKVKFESQHNDEELLLLVRAHPITFIPWILTSIVLFFLPLGLNILLIQFFNLREVLFINFAWYSFLFSYIFLNVVSWLFNVGIVTDERIVDIDYAMILNKEVTGTSIEDVTDVTAHTTGFVRSFFQYGDVFVQTAGRTQNIDFIAVPLPGEVVSIINRLMR